MMVHPLYDPQDAQTMPGRVLQAGGTTTYDSVRAGTEVPAQQPAGIERVMLAEDKLYVVLAVVLIIWFGLAFFVFRTDRRLDRLERTLDENRSQGP